MNVSHPPTWYERWQRFSSAVVHGFHVYASWLVSISWRRFVVLALLLLIGANILQSLPPFTWRITEQVEDVPRLPKLPKPQKPAKVKPLADKHDKGDGVHYEVSIDEHGIRVTPGKSASPAEAAKPAESPAPAEAAEPATAASGGFAIIAPGVNIRLPKSADKAEIKRAVEEARAELEKAVQEAREAKEEAEQEQADAREAQQSAEQVREETQRLLDEVQSNGSHSRTRVIHLGDFLVDLAALIVLASAVIKITYKGRIQAEVKAAQAAETAEAESLKRQVVEARMAAMQAQVEPHFLFNTLASIDHLIETDPPRASQMQRNLIALLRASMPTMREANASGVRDLGRELAVIRPYLEILKVRMEERLQTEIDVPEGLLSAEFPPMMIQSLVENAIKHGLEPKAEGGSLKVRAEIVHGKLAVTVADTGLGFGRAATAGTGVGLANIRERLMLLYGSRGSVTISENQPSGTVVTITVPYRSRNEEGAST
ncbi:histidine kinase [Paucibacter sp. APW11]|uniref:histidine kinase n=1 Tax=Roseateles aquae TaxID=3077235 RepID=A0ABU3PBT7_9BURK|nr:histidine kinase [Paucibacter sp. APW11]MDT9000019.1 histidine kinase [Paucibacter sp. APW11]